MNELFQTIRISTRFTYPNCLNSDLTHFRETVIGLKTLFDENFIFDLSFVKQNISLYCIQHNISEIEYCNIVLGIIDYFNKLELEIHNPEALIDNVVKNVYFERLSMTPFGSKRYSFDLIKSVYLFHFNNNFNDYLEEKIDR